MLFRSGPAPTTPVLSRYGQNGSNSSFSGAGVCIVAIGGGYGMGSCGQKLGPAVPAGPGGSGGGGVNGTYCQPYSGIALQGTQKQTVTKGIFTNYGGPGNVSNGGVQYGQGGGGAKNDYLTVLRSLGPAPSGILSGYTGQGANGISSNISGT